MKFSGLNASTMASRGEIDGEAVGSGIANTIGELLAKVDSLTPGTEVILGRMMELLFVELLRRHAGRLPPGSKGLLAALNDPLVGRALHLLQADAARRWTTDELAREVGASRTVLGERFNAVLGKPPIEYLTGWRIQLAADRLRNGREAIARIAVDSGYESEAAFNRAFKRVTGLTPGRWRDGEGTACGVSESGATMTMRRTAGADMLRSGATITPKQRAVTGGRRFRR